MGLRELGKCLGSAGVLAGDAPIELEHLPEAVRQASQLDSAEVVHHDSAEPSNEPIDALRPLSATEELHRDELLMVLREHQGNISAVARAMGKARVQIQRWIKRYGIDPARAENQIRLPRALAGILASPQVTLGTGATLLTGPRG